MSEYTEKCRICGELYIIYSFYAGDQSACPECRAKARRMERLNGIDSYEPIFLRKQAD